MIETDEKIHHEDEITEEEQLGSAAQPETVEEQGKRQGWVMSPWLLLLIGLFVGGLVGFNLRPLVFSETSENTAPLASVESSGEINEPDPHQAVMLAVIAGARHFYGDPNAPVTLVEFGDFNCGYCARWAHETLPRINEKYIETGKVRMAYVHFPILGHDSMVAAEASECAAQQETFWEYHSLVYANQGMGYTPDHLTALAGELDLDEAAFAECLANFPERESLDDDIRLAQVMGVRGTPAFLVNGVPLAGAYPYDAFEEIIDEILVDQPELSP